MGHRAFWRSFNCGRFWCVGGGRDFFWLTLLLSLVISMALLLVGSRAGLLERFTDAILGTLRPHGVPIWVTAHWENHEGIQTNLLARLRALEKRMPGESFGISVHPYRRLAANSPQIRLPVESIWTSGEPWVGWAVYADDPLWKLVGSHGATTFSTFGWSDSTPPAIPHAASRDTTGSPPSLPGWRDALEPVTQLLGFGEPRVFAPPRTQQAPPERQENAWQGLPLTIVLSESIFFQQFDYAAYREVMQPVLRKKKLSRLPLTPPQDNLKNALHTLWLKVMIGNREVLVPFNVEWVHHIPGMEKVAYLFPLTTYHALLAAYHFPELRYNPETQGKGNPKQFKHLTASTFPRQAMADYAHCVHAAVAATGLVELPNVGEDQCPKPRGLSGHLSSQRHRSTPHSARGDPGSPPGSPQAADAAPWDTLNHDSDNHIWLPCHRLPRSNALRGTLCPGRSSASETGATPLFVPWDVTADGTSFAAMHVYVPDPTRLSRGIKGLLALRTPDGLHALSIQTMYQDALNRFNLLSDLLSTMVPAYALTFGLFLSALLLAQVGTLIGHRRHHYGILLSRGFTWIGIYAKLILQVTLATLTGGCLAVFVFIPALRLLLDEGFARIIRNYQDLLPPGYHFEVLPLPWTSILSTLGQVFAAVLMVTLFVLIRLPLRGNTAPSDLLHGDGQGVRALTRRN